MPDPLRPTAVACLTDRDGPDALPTGVLRPLHNYSGDTPIADPLVGDVTYSTETYRMRVVPHLYDERDLEIAAELRSQMIPTGYVDRDCHACKQAVVTRSAADPCPYDGSRRLSQPV